MFLHFRISLQFAIALKIHIPLDLSLLDSFLCLGKNNTEICQVNEGEIGLHSVQFLFSKRRENKEVTARFSTFHVNMVLKKTNSIKFLSALYTYSYTALQHIFDNSERTNQTTQLINVCSDQNHFFFDVRIQKPHLVCERATGKFAIEIGLTSYIYNTLLYK